MKKVVFVPHCLLNHTLLPNEHSCRIARKVLELFLNEEVSIIQLPCPKLQDYKEISEKVLKIVKEYLENGFKVLGIIGIESSSFCGVYKIKKKNRILPGRGVLIKEFENGMKKQNFQIPIMSVDLNNGFTFLEKMKTFLKSV